MNIARISKDNRRQTLKEHLCITGGLCAALGTKIYMTKLAQLAAEVHDMGKSCPRFQDYIIYCATHPDDKSKRGSVKHAVQGARYIYARYSSKEDKIADLTAMTIAWAVLSHHVGPYDFVSPEGTQPFLDSLLNDNPELSYKEVVGNYINDYLSEKDLDDLFAAAKEELAKIIRKCKKCGIGTNFACHLVARFLLSCLIDADRLDAYLFETNRYSDYLDKDSNFKDFPCGIDLTATWNDFCLTLENYLAERFFADSTINRSRQEISDACFARASDIIGVCRLSVPTGGGKTLSVLRLALNYAKKHSKDRIIYVCPFVTIIDQNAKGIRIALQCDNAGTERYELIFEHHSYRINDNTDEESGKEREFANEAELISERWDCPIVMTTLVQFMDTLYSGRTQNIRRFNKLANAIIIFDEIQSLPPNCVHLFNSAVNFLNKICNSTTILCTATQPALDYTERKLLLDENSEIIQNLSDIFEAFKRTRIVDARRDIGYAYEEFSDFVFDKLQGLNSGLIILNTKKDAWELYSKLKYHNDTLPEQEKYHIYHLSTNMCPKHRKKILEEMKLHLENDRVICVSTQLIEAGVDISFKTVFRALAGLDSIAQAAGRCNRHGKWPCGNVYIVNIANESLKYLPEIRKGQDITARILSELSNLDNLLSPETMTYYYKMYFTQNKPVMDYPVLSISDNANIYDMLCQNKYGCSTITERNLNVDLPPLPLKQAFRTAGEHFSVIKDNTYSLLVPYGNGKSLIEKIRKEYNLYELKKLLRQSQLYSVNIYIYTKNKLSEFDAIEPLQGGVLALKDGFYDDQTGIIIPKPGIGYWMVD
jgi:CRISPR-associated endonuclease/helicase Cas3